MDKHSFILCTCLLLLVLPTSVEGQPFDQAFQTIMNSRDITDTACGEHGGRIIKRFQFTFESVVDPDGIRIYIYDVNQKLIDSELAGGIVKFPKDSGGFEQIKLSRQKDRGKRTARFRSTKPKRGYYLFAPYDFSLTADGSFRWLAEISGLPGQTVKRIRYALPFSITCLAGWSCRGHKNRVFPKFKDYPLCEKRYLDPAPFLYQCPLHPHSRSDHESECPLCSSARVPTRQN